MQKALSSKKPDQESKRYLIKVPYQGTLKRTLSRYLKTNVKSTLSKIYRKYLKSALSRDLIKNLKAVSKASLRVY